MDGNVWMAEFEIAELFGVRYSTVRSAIKTVFKSEAFSEHKNMRYEVLENGNSADLYDIEVITAVAFLLYSPPVQFFRQWLTSKMRQKVTPPMFINLGSGSYIC